MAKNDACDTAGGPLDFSVLADAVGYRVRRAHLAIQQDFVETFSAHGISAADFAVLKLLSRNPGLKQSEIAEALGIQRANFVAIIDGLQERGFAERRKSDTDRRVQCLYITTQGQEHLKQLMPVWRSHEQRLLARLGGAAARDQLVELLRRLYE